MVICICGKSGSGKSTIARKLNDLIPNSIHIDIDIIGHKSHLNEDVRQELINTFGNKIITNKNIDRKKLSKIVFSNKDEMKKLEQITWEYMEKEIDNIIDNNKNKIIILDWLLLPKTKYFNNNNFKILVDIPYEIRKERAMKRDNIKEETFDLRDKASIDYDNKSFDYIIKENTDIKRLVKLI